MEQELAYWTAIEKRLKDGTQDWYDAKEKISDQQNDITEAEAKAAEQKLKTHVNVQDDILDAYKVYYNLSSKAEAEYWTLPESSLRRERKNVSKRMRIISPSSNNMNLPSPITLLNLPP